MAIYYTVGTDTGAPCDGAPRWRQLPLQVEILAAAEAARAAQYVPGTLHVVKVTGQVQSNSLD